MQDPNSDRSKSCEPPVVLPQGEVEVPWSWVHLEVLAGLGSRSSHPSSLWKPMSPPSQRNSRDLKAVTRWLEVKLRLKALDFAATLCERDESLLSLGRRLDLILIWCSVSPPMYGGNWRRYHTKNLDLSKLQTHEASSYVVIYFCFSEIQRNIPDWPKAWLKISDLPRQKHRRLKLPYQGTRGLSSGVVCGLITLSGIKVAGSCRRRRAWDLGMNFINCFPLSSSLLNAWRWFPQSAPILTTVCLSNFQENSDIVVGPCILSIRCLSRTTSIILITNNMALRSLITTFLAVPLLRQLIYNSLLATMIISTTMIIITNRMVPTLSAAPFNFPPANLPVKPFAWNCRRYKRLIWVES